MSVAGLSGNKRSIVVIGASSGGPPALFQLLPRFPEWFAAPIVLVQHMPPGFTRPFADLLNENCGLEVKEAESNEIVSRGKVLVAPAPNNLIIENGPSGSAVVKLSPGTPGELCCPRIDHTMASTAAIYGNGTVGVVLSGMSAGGDCVKGAEAIRKAGGVVLTQDQASAECYGMPEAVIQAGWSNESVPLAIMYERIVANMAND